MDDKTDLVFPIFGYQEQETWALFTYVAVVESPGVAFIVMDPPLDTGPNVVILSVLGVWPVFVVCMFLAYIAGFIVWVAVRPVKLAFAAKCHPFRPFALR